MIIDWNKAPEWANWAAMDEDGAWYWYENKPKPCGSMQWVPQPSASRYRFMRTPKLNWRKSRQKRPEAS